MRGKCHLKHGQLKEVVIKERGGSNAVRWTQLLKTDLKSSKPVCLPPYTVEQYLFEDRLHFP